MGFFDRLFGRSAPSPAEAPSEPKRPPFQATVASFEPVDGVGTLSVEGQPPLKFGRSACRGFEPVVGAIVEVTAASPHPLGGWRATELQLRMDPAAYDALLAARDAALGVKREPANPVEEAAAVSQTLGWIIVLLDEAPPRGPAAFGAWAERLGLTRAGLRVGTADALHLGAGRHDALAYVGDGPFPRERLAEFGFRPGDDAGGGFIGLSLGLPGTLPLLRQSGIELDPWAADGMLRDLSRVASELSKHGPAVILPQAGTSMSSQVFRERLGDLDDLSSRPFGAWAGFAVHHEERVYSSFGLGLHALPNVCITVDVEDGWELDRAREAILVACSQMVHAGRELEPGARVTVPVGQPVDARPVQPLEGDVETWLVEGKVAEAGGALRLRRETPGGARAAWARAPEGREPRVGRNTYQALARRALGDKLEAFVFTGLTPQLAPEVPPFEVAVWEARAGDAYFMTTVGVGRLAQRFGDAEQRTEHVELIAAMQAHHPLIAHVLATVGASVHLQQDEGGVFKPGDTVGLPFPEANAAGFVLADAGSVSLAAGPPLQLLELVPLSRGEYDEARTRGSAGVLRRLGPMTPAARASRWALSRLN